MRLIHYSKVPVTSVKNIAQKPYGGDTVWAKPRGLWVSVDTAWKEWCKAEEFNLNSLKYEYEVTLTPDANILEIHSPRQLDTFTAMYKGDTELNQSSAQRGSGYIYEIDWPRVAQMYQGIIINPYIYARRLDRKTFWYYGWDCASGCIWDASAIKLIKPIRRETHSKKRVNV